MSDYVDMNREPDLLPDHLANPQAKQAYEADKKAEVSERLNRMKREIQQNPDLLKIDDSEEVVYLRNNRPFPVDVSEAGVIIGGQLADDNIGPFATVPRKVIDSHMVFSSLLEPNDQDGRTVLTEITKEQHKEEYKAHQERRRERKQRMAAPENQGENIDNRDDFTVAASVPRNMAQDQE